MFRLTQRLILALLVLTAGACEPEGRAVFEGEPAAAVAEPAPEPRPEPDPGPAPEPQPEPEPAPDPFSPTAGDVVLESSVASLRRAIPTELELYALLSPDAVEAVTPEDRFTWSLEGARMSEVEGRSVSVTATGSSPLEAAFRWERAGALVAERALRVPLRAVEPLLMPAAPEVVPAPPVAEVGSARIAVVSDSNGSYGSADQPGAVSSAVDAMIAHEVDLVIHVGDMVAGQSSSLSRAEIDAMWAGYHATVTDPLDAWGILLIPVPGNHDADPGLTHDRPAYIEEWSARRPGVSFVDDTHYPLAYSFTYAGSFFLVLDGAVGRLDADGALWSERAQLDWIEAQLEAAQGYQHRFAFSHLPFESFVERDGVIWDRGGLSQGDALFSVFIEHNLDVFFTAHYHVYFKGLYPGPSPELHNGAGLNVVSTGRLGSGARYLIGQRERQSRAFVMVDIEDGYLRDLYALLRDDAGVYSGVFDESTLSERAGAYFRFDQ